MNIERGERLIKEYGIYIRQGSGTPYMLHIFKNVDSAKLKLFEMIQLEEDRERPYFVDNDFYNNKYNISTKLRYFKIMERDVSDCQQYSEENYPREENNKILYFGNYRGCK